MKIEEARELLSQYADGLLEPQPARELESVLAETPALQLELKQIKDENALLEEALSPLRSTRSRRMRISEAMVEMHRQASNVAESMPERGWRLFRLTFCFFALLAAVLAVHFRPPSSDAVAKNGVLLMSVAFVYSIGILFLLLGGPMAHIESGLKNAFTPYKTKPSALGVLLVEVFGAAMMLGAFAMYWRMV